MSFGPAFNTGHVHSSAENRLSLGSNVLFHPAMEIGCRITPDVSVSVYIDHSSNAGLARYNDGLTNLGFRIGLRLTPKPAPASAAPAFPERRSSA